MLSNDWPTSLFCADDDTALKPIGKGRPLSNGNVPLWCPACDRIYQIEQANFQASKKSGTINLAPYQIEDIPEQYHEGMFEASSMLQPLIEAGFEPARLLGMFE